MQTAGRQVIWERTAEPARLPMIVHGQGTAAAKGLKLSAASREPRCTLL